MALKPGASRPADADALPSVTILLTGDVMTGRGIDQVQARPGSAALHESYIHDARDYVRMAERLHGRIPLPVAPQYIWGPALAEMAHYDPDVRVVNLETAVTTSDRAWPGKGVHYRMHPANLGCLTAAYIDCCVLANNHVLDWGREGLDETLHALRNAAFHTAGAGVDGAEAWAPAMMPLPGGARLLVFACGTASSGVPLGWSAAPKRSGIALLHELTDATVKVLAEDVARHRSPGDLVLVSLHWGRNWGLDVPAAHRQFAHHLIDLGAADVVHGHSSHHPLPVEIYKGKAIFYGCGDLINDYEGIQTHGDLRSDVGCLYFGTLACHDGTLRRLDIVPMQLKKFSLTGADGAARQWLERVFTTPACKLKALPAKEHLPAWTLLWEGRS